MPFKSEAQRRYLWANEPEIARDWTDTYGSRIQKNNGGIMSMQGGMKNYLGEQPMVNAPKYWQSAPDHEMTELAYITPRERDVLVDMNMYGSMDGSPNEGPSGIMSLNGGYNEPGGFQSGQNISEAETGGDRHGMSDQDAREFRSAAVSAGAGQKVNQGIIEKGLDFYNKYGLIPNAIKSFKNLKSKWGSGWDTTMGPRIDMGYNPNRVNPFSKPDGGEGILHAPVLPHIYTDYYADVDQNLYDDDETVDEVEDFVQRFRVADDYRQQPGTIDTPITYT